MKELISMGSNTIPAVAIGNSFNIIEQTFGRYFAYKENTALIEKESIALSYQKEIRLKEIDTAYELALDMQSKAFKKEMYQLKTLGKTLKIKAKERKMILENISKVSDVLLNPQTSTEERKIMFQLLTTMSETFEHALNNSDENAQTLLSSQNSQNLQIEGK